MGIGRGGGVQGCLTKRCSIWGETLPGAYLGSRRVDFSVLLSALIIIQDA